MGLGARLEPAHVRPAEIAVGRLCGAAGAEVPVAGVPGEFAEQLEPAGAIRASLATGSSALGHWVSCVPLTLLVTRWPLLAPFGPLFLACVAPECHALADASTHPLGAGDDLFDQ